MSLATRILTRSKTALSETASLTTALVKEPATSTTKARDVFIRHARTHNNSVAASVLLADREVGLVRYHGIQGYAALWAQGNPNGLVGMVYGGSGNGVAEPLMRLKKLMYGTRVEHGSEETTADGEGNQGVTSSPKRTAKVAFMITASQRMELTTRLGYGTDEIKKLKPLEALLILEHGVEPGNDEHLWGLVRENEELQRAEAQEVIAEHRMALDQSTSLAAEASRREDDTVKQAHAFADSSNEDTGAALSEQPSSNIGALQNNSTNERTQNDRLLEISGGFDFPPPPPPEEGTVEGSDLSESYPMKETNEEAWVEVVETDGESGVSTVVALYKTEEEAKDCIDWKMDVARRRHQEKQGSRPMSRFELRLRH